MRYELPKGVKPPRGDILSTDKHRLEKDVEGAWCKIARNHGWAAYKFMSPGNRSVPDRKFNHKPRVLFYTEFKRPGKEPTEDQWLEINKLRAMGFCVLIIDWYDKEFVEFLFAWHY
jgi:hypothetical protein